MIATEPHSVGPGTRHWWDGIARVAGDFLRAADSLRQQKTRTFLTALGIVFGVGSVIGMLSIGEGAKQESLRFIEELGVRNILIDSIPATSQEELQQRRRTSPGLTERDVRIIEANVTSLENISPRRNLHPGQVLPKPSRDVPELLGVRPSYAAIHNLRLAEGNFFDDTQNDASDAVCVLGETAKVSLLGYDRAVGKYVKVNDTWLRVVGVLRARIATQGSGRTTLDVNNIIYVPFNTYKYRFWDQTSYMKDDLDGVDLQLRGAADSVEVAKVVTAILNSTHHNTNDYLLTIPAALLAQQQHIQAIFTYVMVAIAAISLLVGGIGIMNIVLSTVLERTREIGIRRATGARRRDIIRQFLVEAVLISLSGGILGIACGFFLAWLIATLADWKTIVTPSSVIIAAGVSAAVGIVFGIYPAVKASRINPIDALRYE